MPRLWLRFLLTEASQRRIDPASIRLTSDADVPDALHIEFRVLDPTGGAPEVMPLFPGSLEFIADAPSRDHILPEPTDIVDWTEAEYNSWQTTGRVMLTLDASRARQIESIHGLPPVIPRIIWLWPVSISQEFLFLSIRGRNGLRRLAIKQATGGSIDPMRLDWPNHAVSGFLKGTYSAPLRADSSDPATDDAARLSMPEFVMDGGTGQVAVTIALAGAETNDDGLLASVDALASALPLLDPRHPRYGRLHTRQFLTLMRDQLFDGGPGLVLADPLMAPWPAGPRYFNARFSIPGSAQAVYFCGLLPDVEVRVEDAQHAVLRQGQLTTSGWVTLEQQPPAAGDPLPGPLDTTFTLTPGDLRLTQTNGIRANLLPDQVRFAFDVLEGDGHATLQPQAPDPADAAAVAVYSAKLADICHSLGRDVKTRNAVKEILTNYEAILRPSAWTAADLVFRGTREPWSSVNPDQLTEFFNGLQNVSFSNTLLAPPPIRPGEAITLWLMEGKLSASGALGPTMHPFGPIASEGRPPFDPADVASAGGDRIRDCVRSFLLWSFWGLDVAVVTVVDPAIQDTRPDWSGGVAAAAAANNAKMDAALGRIAAAGIVAPSRAAVTSTIEVTRTAGAWQWRVRAGHVATMIWLQYSEYLRRQLDPAMPAGATAYPAFNYAAYNGGVGAASGLWDRAQAVLNGAAKPAWVTTPEDALRSWPLTAAEIALTPRTSRARSRAPRINGLHFAAVAHSYGAVFPWDR
jgi:hypothetical protein